MVNRIALAIDPLFFIHFNFKTPGLLNWVRQFAKGIGKLHPAGIELKPLGHAGVMCCGPRQRCLTAEMNSEAQVGQVAASHPTIAEMPLVATRELMAEE